MTLLKQAMAILGTALTIAVLVAIISPKTAQAVAAAFVQIQPGTTTHMGQNESQLVDLYCGEGAGYCVTISPEGIYGTSPYVVPAGYTLIATDWTYISDAGLDSPGNTRCDSLFVGFYSLTEDCTTVGSDGGYHAHAQYVTGLRIGSGQTLKDYTATEGWGQALIQGYLVPN